MRVTITTDVDVDALVAELSTALGHEVAVCVRQPGQSDEHGNPLPGVVDIVDSKTGSRMGDDTATRTLVEGIVFGHTPPPPQPTAQETLINALGSATDFAGLKAALSNWATGL